MSGGVGFNISDPASQGYHVERDERANVEPGEHAVKRAVAVDRRNPEGDYHTKDRSRGDVQPRLLWQNATGRAIPSWGAAWPAVIHEAQKDGAPGAGGTQGVGARSASVLPVRDRGVNDDRYEPIIGPYRPPWASYLPRDWTGVLVPASEETRQTEVFVPGAHGLVASHMGDAKLSTAVVDLTPDDRVDVTRRALLRSHLRVVKLPLGTTPGRIGGLSWWIGNAGVGASGGAAAGVQPGRIGDTRSGYVTDCVPANGLATTIRGAPDPVVHGLASCNHGGPFDVGGINDRHRIGVDEDGNSINPLHISTNALFRTPDSGTPGAIKSGTDRDGPLFFEPGTPPPFKLGSGIARRVHLQFADGAGGPGGGKWIWWSEDEIDDDYIPPRTPPTIQPQPRKIAGTLKGEPRPLLHIRREIAFNSIVLRPQSYAPGDPDLRNHVGPIDEATAARYARAPAVCRIESAAVRSGSGVGALPTYTYAPGAARYKGGTASGVVAYFPPEVGMEDEDTNFAPTGVTLSTVHVVYHKGKVLHGSGLPDVKAGVTKSGYTWGANASTGAMEFHERSSTGAITSTNTLPKRTGTVVQAPSALSANYIPRADANGDLVVSAVSDDGSNVLAARDGLVLGVAQDVQVSSAGAGLLKISDYTGGTGASLIFAAATSGHPRLRANSNTLETKLGDNSGYAKHVANVLESKVATGTAPLIVASTTVVTNLNADTVDGYEGAALATPADNVFRIVGSGDATKKLAFEVDGITTGTTRTITAPNRDGTIAFSDGSLGLGEIPEGDSNGDLTASGLTSQVITRLFSPASQTASNGGNYSVAAGVGTTFVDASALTAGQNYDVTLPSAVTYSGRRSTVKITTAGAGGATVTVKSSAGTVEGVAAATGVPLDASARSKVTYQSDGTNWWSV